MMTGLLCYKVERISWRQSETVNIKRKNIVYGPLYTMVTSVIKRAKMLIYAYLGNKRFSITFILNIRSSMLLFRVGEKTNC